MFASGVALSSLLASQLMTIWQVEADQCRLPRPSGRPENYADQLRSISKRARTAAERNNARPSERPVAYRLR